ncbi:conserved hypothetical protein [Leishmania mexicana MHOM/GT/2001/U1103]|uniref:Uncharacterized protein n=1 Tax=Leishmania mexicana (strain MHOM/GT/2001/U1103) TaxID=929439 RepID=E9AR71_LEIMU|nr:conserved hypothetical protein [Leishmania mexicana MHOM/GT/2001/U1103]CBZ25458.1 conserved hypothetical protein [Leishmania mexicana MHOM/GT/2001/U1103]
MASAPPIDLEGFCLAVRHNVFANYRTLPVHCAQRSYEQLPVRYRAGLDAISADVLQQQQQRDQQQGSTDAVSASDEVANVAVSTSVGGGGAVNMGHPRGGRSEGSSTGLSAAAPGAAGYVTEGCHDPVTFIGMGYYGSGGRGGAWPATMNLSGSIGAASTATTPAASPSWLSRGESMCLDTSVFPSLPSCAMEERAAATIASPVSAPTTSTPGGAAAPGPMGSPLPSSSPTSAVTTTSATIGDAAAGAGLVSRVALLHHVQQTIQSFIARGEREVALHFIMATAPYRFSGTTDSDRVLAFFNQIRFFLPSPRFGIVMLAMEAWRSLYRPSVGAGAADCTHMTLELLALIETYLCHGRTYAEYVSGLLMLRAVLALAMENSPLCSRTAAVLLQHRSLLQGRLPTFLLAVWLILMEFYTIDDTVLPPRRVLRDLAANAMQDLFTVALELHMTLPVQNVVANAVSVFFTGPQPQAQLGLSPLVAALSGEAAVSVEVDHRGGAEASNNSSVNADTTAAGVKAAHSLYSSASNNAGKSVDSEAMMLPLRTLDVPAAAAAVGVRGSGAPGAGAARSPSPSRPTPSTGNGVSDDTANATMAPLPPHRVPGAGGASAVASVCLSRDPTESRRSALRTGVAAPASPAPQAPASSYRAVAKWMWASVKRAARRLSHSTSMPSPSPALATTAAVDGRRDTAEAAGGTQDTFSSAPGRVFAPSAFDLPRRMASARTMAANRHPSPPLLVEVLEDIFRESMEADLSERAEAVARSAGSAQQQGLLSTTSAVAGGRWLVQSSSSPFSQVARRVSVTNSTAGGGRGTMLSSYHALWQPSAVGLPLLRSGSWAQRRQQRRSFSVTAAAATTLGLESSALSDPVWGDIPFDGTVSDRDTLWTLPLARALRAAGRPQTLEATVAASTLTLGAFLCAWRIAGFSDETDSDYAGSRASRHLSGMATATAASPGASPTEVSIVPSGEPPLPRYFGPASGGAGSGDANPFTEGVVLPLLTPESLVAAAGSGVLAGCRDSLGESASLPHPSPATGSSTAMPPGVGASSGVFGVSTGEPEKPVSMLPTTISALASRTGASRCRGRLLASTATDADPEWQSVESAATNVYVPPVAGVAPPIVGAARATTGAARDEVSAATPAVSTDMAALLAVPPLPDPRASPSLHVAQGAVGTAAAPGNGFDNTGADHVPPAGLLGAAAGAVATPDAAGLVASATVAGRQSGLPATIPTSTAGLCRARAPPTEVADVSVSDDSRSQVGARGGDGTARLTMAAPRPAMTSGTADGRLNVAAPVPQTPSLSFFLPSWAAARVMERCVRPCWDAIGPAALSSTADGARAATRHTSAVVVTKEAEILLSSVVPLLSQYYVDALSASTVTAATQVLVNRAIQSVKSLSQGLRDCSSHLGANSRGGAPTETTTRAGSGGTTLPSSSAPRESDVAPRDSDMGASHNGAEPPVSSPRAAAPTGTASASAATTTATASTPFASPFSAWPAEDSALVDGTELLNAILFMTTVAERYPAVYERMIHQRLYPLLHHILLLHNAAVEEPQLWLSMPPSSAAVAAHFKVGDRARAAPPLVPPPQQLCSSQSVTSPTAMEGEAVIQRVRLITARAMYQRLAMPALVLLAHNMPDDACARRCYPLVVRLAQLGLRRPFSMASVTTALCICAVYPPLSRVCQSELVRAMAVVLATPDDGLSDGDDDGADNAAAPTASREAEADGVRARHHSRRAPPQARPEDEPRGTREEDAIASKPAGPTRAAVLSPRPFPMTAATAAASQASLPRPSSRRAAPTTAIAATGSAAPPMWRSRLNLQLFFPCSTNVGHLRLPAASMRAARRRQAVQTRLVKHHCFRAMSLFYSSWEGTTLLFLEVCLPYLWHPDAQLRLECVQCCMRWLLSDCWHSTDQALLHHHAATPTASAGGVDAAPSTALTSFRNRVTAAVTRAPVRDPRTTANSGSSAKGGVHGTAALRCLTTLSAPAPTQTGQVRVPYRAPPRQTAEVLRNGVSSGPAVPTATARAPGMSICTVQHHGRTHVNALREVVHHLVELAVCDPEPLIRKCALESLSPETYPLLYPHEPFVHQLFTVLWDSYMPNRSRAAVLLCALAPLNPSSIFPRLRQVLVQYTEDLTNSIARLAAPSLPAKRSSALLPVAPPGHIHEDALFVLFQIASRLKQSTQLYLPQLLSIVSSVLRSGSSPRGSVLQALHFLVALREDSTEEQSALFAPFFDLVAQQLIDGDGDTARLLATVAALQSLLQQFTGSAHSSSQTLPMVVERLHSLLYRKPSVVTEFAMAVLQLLGTISSIEPWDAEAAPRAPALLRRPQNRYPLPPLSSSAGVLGRGRAVRSRWLDRDERADSAAEALAQLQKADRFAPFTARAWCDTVLRALMRTVSGYVNGTMSQTQGGLCTCLAAIMNILTNTVAIHHLELYLPTVLTLVIDLLEKRQTRWRDIETAYQSSAHNPHSSTTTATGRGDGAATAVGPAEVGKINDSSEAIRLLFLRRLFDLVLVAGRRIGPMYPLLNVFLRGSWKTMSPRGLVQCCEVLDALCWAVPDLLRDDCDVWIPSLLEALIQYDALVVTHRRAHEGVPDSAPAAANTSTGAVATGIAAGAAVTPTESEETPTAPANTSRNFSASANRMSPARHGSVVADANDSSSSPLKKPHTPSQSLHSAAVVDGTEEAPWEQQLKLVYQALTLCLTSLQPLVPPLEKRFVAVSLSECLKSSHVPRGEAVRRTAAPTAAAAPTDGRTEQGAGFDAEHSATLATSTPSSLQSLWPATGATTASAVFDLMADPHEELISFLNACVCRPLLEYMVHSNLSTVSMKLVKNLLSRLESLSAVHEEALQRLWGAMSRRTASLLSQPEGSGGLSWMPDVASGSATCPDGSVGSLAAPARAQLEVKLREARELLHLQCARQHEEGGGSANVSGCGAGTSSLTAFYAAPRSASEALWFNNAALSRMWVQSADRAVTVRRYFPFDAVHTSWETEGEVQLLGCLLVSAAWHHPPSTTAFATTLHTYFAQRFGPDSVAVAYVRCICSSYYNLCMPLASAHDEEMVVKWAVQQQQRVATTGSGSDAGTESDTSLTTVTRSAVMRGPGLHDAAGQMTREGSADVILRHPRSPVAQATAAAAPARRSTAASPKGGAALSGLSGMGSRAVSWEEDAPALTIARGEGTSASSSAAATAFAGASGTRATTRWAQSNSAAASLGSVLTTTAIVRGDSTSDMALARPMVTYPSMERLDSSSDGRRSAEMNTTVRFSDHDEDQDGNGRTWTDSHYTRHARSSNGGSAMPHRAHISHQQLSANQLHQPQYPLPTGTATSTPLCGPNSLPRTITAHSTNGADTSPSTTHNHSPTTATLAIPVEAGVGGSLDNYVNASAPVGLSGLRSGSGSGSSFYPGSFFTSAVAAEGRVGCDGGACSGVVNSTPHHHHPHASLGAGDGGPSADVEAVYGRGSSEAVPPAHASVGGGTGVHLTTPICRPFQLPHPQPFPTGQSHAPYPVSSRASPNVNLGPQPAASPTGSAGMLGVGSFTAASVDHPWGVLGLPASAFSPVGGVGGGAPGGPGGTPPPWRFASIAASVTAADVASPNSFTMPPSSGGVGGATFPFAVASHDAAAVQQQACRRLSPLVSHPPLHHHLSSGTMAAPATATMRSRGGSGNDLSGHQLQPPPVHQAQRQLPPSPFSAEASATSATTWTAAAGAVRSTTTTAAGAPPLRAEARVFTSAVQSPAATTQTDNDGPTSPAAAAASDRLGKEAATSPCVAREMAEACAAFASAHEAGEVTHKNSLIAYFELHRSISGHGWRSWWEQFCLYLLQCSPDYCIQACEPFARQHHIAFSYSELLPLALLSTLPSCTVAELVAWLRALRDFYAFHTDPSAPVPQQVASGVARVAHDIRLYHRTFFPPEVVSRVVDVWLPESVVAELANRSLNPPLRILYLEQDLARFFSWGCTALLMVSADDVASALERTLFVQDPRFQQWLSAVAATASEMRSRDSAVARSPGRRRRSCKPVVRSAAAVAKSSSSTIGILTPSALELLGFHRAAALEYVRLYEEQQLSERRDSRRGVATEEDEAAQCSPGSTSKDTAARHHSSAAAARLIVGAMRCHICLCDFEAVLRLWEVVKGRGAADTTTAMTSSSLSTDGCSEASDGDSGSAVVRNNCRRASSCVLSPETARYVVMSAQALSRWDYVQEAAHYAFGCASAGGLSWTTGAPQAVQEHTHKSGGPAANSAVTPHVQQLPQPPGNPRWAEDVGEEGRAEQFLDKVFSSDLPPGTDGTVELRAVDHTRESLLQRQMEVFVGAALVAAHDYDGAKRALTAVRDGLRDSYAVFHSDNNRVKLEWSSVFQQLSDLEEGMHALEQVPAAQEGMGAVPTCTESGGTSAAWPGAKLPALDREINGKLFPEATVRRLRNITCRPVSATTTILQLFMIIAVRSAIAPVTWQLDNVLALGERLEKAGQPMRAVQVLHHYANLPVVATSFTTTAVKFKQQLSLEMLRRLIRNLSSEKDLREVHACVQTALRNDLWLARCAATRRMSAVSPTSSFSASPSAAAASSSWPLRNQLAMDGAAPRGSMLTAQELGPSLSHYQVDLLLLNVACRRRLAHVLLQRAPLAHRPSPVTVASATPDVSAPLADATASNSAPSWTSDAVRPPTNTLSLPIEVGRTPRRAATDVVEDEKASGTDPHSPASSSITRQPSDFPATAAAPLSARSGADSTAGAAAKSCTGDGAGCRHDSTESGCVDRSDTLPAREQRAKMDEAATTAMEESVEGREEGVLSLDSITGKTAMFAEYYLLEQAVAVTCYVPSVWREFGLVLFDVCMAIHAECRSTGDEETKQNFLAQSAKAIHGLQLAAQLWRSQSESVFSRGIGPFPATMPRRHGHARTALPSAHLLLKALYLAVTCEVIVQDDARAAAGATEATTAAAAAAAVVTTSSVSLAPFSASSPAPLPSSLGAGSKTAKDAEEAEMASGTGGGGRTCSVFTTPRALSASQRTEQPRAGACEAETAAGTKAENSRGPTGIESGADTTGQPYPHSASQPQPTAAAAAVTEQQGGFACLDFSPPSYLQWAAVAPFLLAAATHHHSLYAALRDMCVQSRDMLRQLVFPLIAMFEHGFGTMPAPQASHPRYRRASTAEEAPAATASRHLTSTFVALGSEGQEGGRQQQRSGLEASARVFEGEDGDEQVTGVSCSNSTEVPSLLEHPGVAEGDTSDAGLIAKRAAWTSVIEVTDGRHKGGRRVPCAALATSLLPTRASTSDSEAATLGGPTASYTMSASHRLVSPRERPLEEAEREVYSSLLADIAAASPGHRRLIQEAMQLHSFVRGLWEVPTAASRRRSSLGAAVGQDGMDASLASLGVVEGAPPPTQRAREAASSGAASHGATRGKGAASGFVPIDDAGGMHGEMELLLDGFCPLPAPLWLLPSVFGVGMTTGDAGGSRGHDNTGSDEGAWAGKAQSGGLGAGLDAAARGRPHGGQSGGPTSPASTAPATRTAGYRGARMDDGSGGVAGLPQSSATGLPASAAAAHDQRAAHSTTRSAVRFAPTAVPTIMHVRRYAVLKPAPHHQCEEVVFVMLSDGLVCRFRHAAPAVTNRSGEAFGACESPHGATDSANARLGQSRKSGAASAGAGAKDAPTVSGHSGAGGYVLPYALMEQIASLLLSHLPLTHLQRPFVLPLSVQDYMTMLPEHRTSPLILGAATAASVRSDDPQRWRHDMALLTGPSTGSSAAALRTATQLLDWSSDATRTPPSLYHLMDDYTVHLRVREMALAAQEAVEAYPALDLDAMQIAAETGRRPGVSADNAYPFNWAYGYPVSAPPTDEAAVALTKSHKYRDLVQRRRTNEERFDQLVAAAYDDGCVGPLIAFLQGILATRPSPPPPPSSSPPAPETQTGAAASANPASTTATATSPFSASSSAPAPPSFRSPEETFSMQQRLYAYAAVLPRTEAHLRSVLAALSAVVAGAEDRLTRESSTPSSSSSPLSPTVSPVLNTEKRRYGHRQAFTATQATSLSARELQACRLALFRLESARFRLALNDAFSADSSNASHWLEARRTYAKELSEWSVMEYLLDVHTRECGTVLVNTYDGHVAVHALGRYCLQPPPRQSRGACAKEAATYAADVAPLIVSPFPTHDATLFRLTPVLVAGLPLQSAHAAFQYHASSVLYEIFQYGRDLTGIATYGVDCVTAFAHAAAAPNAAPSPSSNTSSIETPLSTCRSEFSVTASGDFGAALPSRRATLRPEGNCACASGSVNAGAATEGGPGPSAAASPRRAGTKAAAAPPKKQREVPPPLESLVGVPAAATSAAPSSAFAALPARGAAQRHPNPPLDEGADASTLPPPPRCFDSSSFRLKLSYNVLLVLHEEAERSGRATMLRLLRSQREATEAQWLHVTPTSPSGDGDEGNAVEAKVSVAGHGAAEVKTGGTPPSPLSTAAGDDEDEDDRAPGLTSAFDLVAAMITAATDEENLLGVDGLCPHTWRRWAPHW